MANTYFKVPQQYIGKNLNQINDELSAGGKSGLGSPSLLANYLGIDQNTALTADQVLSLSSDRNLSPTSGEYLGLQGAFGQGISEQDYQTEKATAAQKAAVAPAISTLQGQVDPLKARYDKLIADIKGRRDTAVQQVGVDTSREFGKRGIPNSSGAFDVALRNAQTPVEQSYGQNLIGAEGEGQDKLMAIQNAIAGLQAGAGKDAITQALQVLQNATSQGNWEKQFNLSQQELDLKKKTQANDPYGLFS